MLPNLQNYIAYIEIKHADSIKKHWSNKTKCNTAEVRIKDYNNNNKNNQTLESQTPKHAAMRIYNGKNMAFDNLDNPLNRVLNKHFLWHLICCHNDQCCRSCVDPGKNSIVNWHQKLLNIIFCFITFLWVNNNKSIAAISGERSKETWTESVNADVISLPSKRIQQQRQVVKGFERLCHRQHICFTRRKS